MQDELTDQNLPRQSTDVTLVAAEAIVAPP